MKLSDIDKNNIIKNVVNKIMKTPEYCYEDIAYYIGIITGISMCLDEMVLNEHILHLISRYIEEASEVGIYLLFNNQEK